MILSPKELDEIKKRVDPVDEDINSLLIHIQLITEEAIKLQTEWLDESYARTKLQIQLNRVEIENAYLRSLIENQET